MTGKTKARIVALRIWVRRRDKRVMRLLLLAFLLCAAAVGMRLRNGGGDQSEAEAIKSIRTEEKILDVDKRQALNIPETSEMRPYPA